MQFICLTLFSISSIPWSAPARGGDSAAVWDVRTSLFEGSILLVTLNMCCPGNFSDLELENHMGEVSTVCSPVVFQTRVYVMP